MPPPSQPTPAQRRIAALAAQLADANPDAAAELARHLAHQAQQRRRWQGLGIMLKYNYVTEQIDMIVGECGTGPSAT